MTNSTLCLTLCLSLLPAVAFAAAPKEHPADTPAPVAAVAPVSGLSQPAEATDMAEGLPEMPEAHLAALSFNSHAQERPVPVERTSRVTFGSPQSKGVSPLASMPLAGTVRHLGAQRFNTDDGSMLDDFAICFRISGRSSIEVIPGDPAPVKLPVVSMANNTGVTVGLVVRLSK